MGGEAVCLGPREALVRHSKGHLTNRTEQMVLSSMIIGMICEVGLKDTVPVSPLPSRGYVVCQRVDFHRRDPSADDSLL